MKQLFIIVTFAIVSCNSEKKWYAGGTLHQATKAQWKSATVENKLATCADFVANVRKDKGGTYNNLDSMKVDAEQMMFCIETALTAFNDNNKVAEIAASCAILSK